MKKIIAVIVLAFTVSSSAFAFTQEAAEVVNNYSSLETVRSFQSQGFDVSKVSEENLVKRFQDTLKANQNFYNAGYLAYGKGWTKPTLKNHIYAAVEKALKQLNVGDSELAFFEARSWEIAEMGYEEAKQGK